MGTTRSRVLKNERDDTRCVDTVIGGSGNFKKEVGRDEQKSVLDVGI